MRASSWPLYIREFVQWSLRKPSSGLWPSLGLRYLHFRGSFFSKPVGSRNCRNFTGRHLLGSSGLARAWALSLHGSLFNSQVDSRICKVVRGEGMFGSLPSYGSSSGMSNISGFGDLSSDGGMLSPSELHGACALLPAFQLPPSESCTFQDLTNRHWWRHAWTFGLCWGSGLALSMEDFSELLYIARRVELFLVKECSGLCPRMEASLGDQFLARSITLHETNAGYSFLCRPVRSKNNQIVTLKKCSGLWPPHGWIFNVCALQHEKICIWAVPREGMPGP